MATILAISSQVVRGHVGLSAIVPVLQRLGHDVWPMPTIVLSNHPGHPAVAATRLPVADLTAMLDALAANGWLGGVDAVLTGYMPSAEHVAAAARAIERVRALRPDLPVLVDPILGDDPKGLYVPAATAAAIRDRLVPLATILKPNRFELSWLTGHDVRSPETAIAAARTLAANTVVATSIPDGAARIANLEISAGRVAACTVDRIAGVPHGTGDMLSAFYLARRLPPQDTAALERAVAGVAAVIAASAGCTELRLVASQADWAAAPRGRAGSV